MVKIVLFSLSLARVVFWFRLPALDACAKSEEAWEESCWVLSDWRTLISVSSGEECEDGVDLVTRLDTELDVSLK